MILNNSFRSIEDRQARVVVCAIDKNKRHEIKNAVSSLGFKSVKGAQSLKALIPYLGSEEIEWLIVGSQATDEVNLFEFLTLAKKHQRLAKILVTPLLEIDDLKYVSYLVELGSYTPLIFENTHMEPELRKGILLEYLNFSEQCHIERLTEALLHERLDRPVEEKIDILKAAITKEPNNGALHLKIANLYLETGAKKEATNSIMLARLLSPELHLEIQKFGDNHFSGIMPKVKTNQASAENPLGIRLAIGVSLNEDLRLSIVNQMQKLGVPFFFSDSPKDAFEVIGENGEPDLIVIDWNLEEMHPSVFVQKIRKSKFHETKLMIVGTDLDHADKAILEEFGVYNIVDAAQAEDFLSGVLSTINTQNSDYLANELFQKIKTLLEDGKANQAVESLKKLRNLEPLPSGLKDLINGFFTYHEDQVEEAKDHVLKSMKNGDYTVECLTLLGKILMALGESQLSFECFDQAQTLSPLNVGRLCVMAENRIDGTDAAPAKELLDEARMLDPTSKDVMETDAKISLLTGDADEMKQCLGKLKGLENFVAFLNNKAVACTREGDLDEGIKLYCKALESLPKKHDKYIPIINFNLGMAHLRSGDRTAAVEILIKCVESKNPKVFEKAQRVLGAVQKAQKTGANLKIAKPNLSRIVSKSKSALKELKKSLSEVSEEDIVRPGEYLLWKLFKARVDRDKAYLLKRKLPRFSEKQETKVGEKTVWL